MVVMDVHVVAFGVALIIYVWLRGACRSCAITPILPTYNTHEYKHTAQVVVQLHSAGYSYARESGAVDIWYDKRYGMVLYDDDDA